MDPERFNAYLERRLGMDGPPLNIRQVPERIRDQIVHMVLMGPQLKNMLGYGADPVFDFDFNEDDEIYRIDWTREGMTTINLIAGGKWYCLHRGEVTSVTELTKDGEFIAVDTETMEAIMMIAGVHPTQVGQ